ncbi:MAG: SDR family oxidoreductase [Planctomycetota bacterium]
MPDGNLQSPQPPQNAGRPSKNVARRVLVSGGTSGIGRAIALGFAKMGDAVLVTGRTREEIEQFEASLESKNGSLRAVACDVRDPAAIDALVRGLDRLDVLINCAGTILREGREHDPEGFEAVIDINLNGTMRVCTACRSLLARSKGCVVNTASMLSFFGSGYVPGYSASKGGIAQLTKSLAIAWATDGIRVNAIAPGWIETPMTKALTDSTERREEIQNRTPLARWGTPEDLTGPAVFLCSEAAHFVTGVILPVDGGYSIA